MKGISFPAVNGSNVSIGIVRARWNDHITSALYDGARKALHESGVHEDNIVVAEVPGAFELPHAARELAKKHTVDAIIAIGCLVKGETMHFEYIADAVSNGLMRLNTDGDVPVIFGVLTCLTEAQALARSTGKNNHGYGWGLSAVAMAKRI